MRRCLSGLSACYSEGAMVGSKLPRKASWRLAWAGLLCLLSCTRIERGVVVSLTGLTPAVHSLDVTAQIGERSAHQRIEPPLDRFGLYLPLDATGMLVVSVRGLDENGCSSLAGFESTLLMDQTQLELTVTLQP